MLSYVDIEAFDPTKQPAIAKQPENRYSQQRAKRLMTASHQRQQQTSSPQQADEIQPTQSSVRQAH